MDKEQELRQILTRHVNPLEWLDEIIPEICQLFNKDMVQLPESAIKEQFGESPYCPSDCQCLGRMLAVCFARPLESPDGRGWTDKIPVVAQLMRAGENYIKQPKCHYDKFTVNRKSSPHSHHWEDGTFYSHSHVGGTIPHGHHGARYGMP